MQPPDQRASCGSVKGSKQGYSNCRTQTLQGCYHVFSANGKFMQSHHINIAAEDWPSQNY